MVDMKMDLHMDNVKNNITKIFDEILDDYNDKKISKKQMVYGCKSIQKLLRKRELKKGKK